MNLRRKVFDLQQENEQLRQQLNELRTQISLLEEVKPLSDTEKRDIASKGSQLVCAFCGGLHHGVCNRVKKVEMDDFGRPKITEFWPEWAENQNTIWPEDIWQSPSQMTEELETQARKIDTATEIQKMTLRENERIKKESERTLSPREIVAKVTRSE